VYLLAMGKAACAMAGGAREVLGPRIRDGLVITKHGHGAGDLPWPVLEAGHPVPDAASLVAGERVLRWCDQLPADAQVLVLISGGASALVESLPDGVSLEHLADLNQWLLASGAGIHEMNVLRRRLSRIKGGRLAARLAPRSVLGLCLSDVPGDDPAIIGSGPLGPVHPIEEFVPLPEHLEAVFQAAEPFPGMPLDHVRLAIVGSNADARAAVVAGMHARGGEATLHRGLLTGDAIHTGERLVDWLAQSAVGSLQVWGGEVSVQLPESPGRGGRCQHLALAAALHMGRKGMPMCLLAAGTDGTDGPGEDAGALVDNETVSRVNRAKHSPRPALSAANSGPALEASGDLLRTGPTGTNVMDLYLGIRV
jgi:hydroxypyruvate reductase